MGQSYRTARGAQIDMGKLINQNELVPAVGNAKVNARGDKLGPGGKIIQRREEVISQNISPIPNQNNVAQQPGPVSVTVKKDIANMDLEGKE